MSILGKLTMRNILGKPLRSFAIIIALAASAFAMLFCIGGRDAPEQQVRLMMLNRLGGAEMQIFDTQHNLKLDPADYPEGSEFLYFANANVTANTPNGEYAVMVTNFDTSIAKSRNMIENDYDPQDGAIVSEKFAKKAGLSEGSTLTLVGKAEKLELKVTKITGDKYLRKNSSSLFVSVDTVKKLGGYEGTGYISAYVNVPDDTDCQKLAGALMNKYAYGDIEAEKTYIVSALIGEEMLEQMNQQTKFFYLIFAVILLMTLFLTFSMSKHIANERLSAVGTLRSLGGSIAKTSGLLMIESTVYGLIGGIIGVVAYLLLGDYAITVMLGSVEGGYQMHWYIYPLAVLFAVVIQLLCQSGTLVKTVRTPVRDIIFSSRETTYVLSIKKTVIGMVLLAAGIIAGLFADDVIICIAAITLICIGSVMVLPLLLKLVSKLFVKLFDILHLPCAKLAANECAHKKSSVASTQLTFVALAITAAVFVTSISISRLYHADIYYYDARIDLGVTEDETLKFLNMPEITEYENLFNYWSTFRVNDGKKRNMCIVGYGEFKLCPSIRDLGEEPAENEAYLGESFAKRLGVKKGDTIRLEDSESYVLDENGNKLPSPVYELKVKGFCNTVNHFNETVVVNKQWFKSKLGDWVNNTYIKVSKPEDLEKVIAKLEKTRRNAYLEPVEEIKADTEDDCADVMKILYSITAVGCVLSLLGAVSNAIIGFEQSKRKYAVLHSVAASKRKLSKLILLETLFSSMFAGGMALLAGRLLTSLVGTTMASVGLGIEVVYEFALTVAFTGVIVVVLLLAAVKPIISLKKMKTAVELKYE